MNIKRILSIVFALILIFSTGIVTANAADAYEYTDENGIRFIYALYNDNGTTKAIIGDCRYNKEKAFTLVFPSKLGGYPVAAIADEALAEHILFNAVKLPDTLEYIGEAAFRNTKVTSVHIPKNVSYIGLGAFGAHDIDFESYTVAKENKYFKAVDDVLYSKDGKYLFNYPPGKTDKSFAVPKGVECIYESAFAGAENLKKVTFPDSLTVIADNAFGGTGLEAVHFGENITYIGEGAFAFSKSLKNITIDENAFPYIGDDAFNWTGLKSDADGGMYVGHILYHLYNPYVNTTVVNIREGTTAIRSNAISNIGDAILNLPSTLIHIPSDTFRNANVYQFSVHKDNPYYTSIDGALYTKDKKTLLVFPYKEYQDYQLADTTEVIYTYAFWDARIDHLIVPESVKVIGDRAFLGPNLTKVTFLGDADYVGNEVFSGCYYIEEIRLPENSVMFGARDFEDTRWYLNRSNGYIYIDNVLLGYKGNFGTTIMDLQDRFTSIGKRAFEGMASINEVRLPENLKAVGDFAFANCPKLKEITIPATVDEIGNGAFGFSISSNSDTGEIVSAKKVEDFVIKGYTNSIAESYADANGFEFVSIGYLQPESTLLGDIDCDGRLTIKDATALQKYVAGMVGLNTQDKINADFNTDGKINVRDATAIQKKLAGLI